MDRAEVDALLEESGGSQFVRLTTESPQLIGTMVDVTEVRRVVWDPEQNRTVPYDKDEHADDDRYRPRMVFEARFYVPGSGVKTLDGPSSLLRAIRECEKEYGTETALKLVRKGAGMDTSYHAMYNRALDESELAELSAARSAVRNESATNEFVDDDTPF